MTASREPSRKKAKEAQQEEQDYVDVSPTQRNWKGIAISLLVIAAVCSLITVSVVVLTPAEPPGSSRSRLTVADLYEPEFHVHDPEATWVSGIVAWFLKIIPRNYFLHVLLRRRK